MTSPDDLKELAPTGKLRGGVVIAPAASAFFAIRDGKGRRTASPSTCCVSSPRRLKLPLDLQLYDNSGQVTDAVATGDVRRRLHAAGRRARRARRFRPGLLR